VGSVPFHWGGSFNQNHHNERTSPACAHRRDFCYTIPANEKTTPQRRRPAVATAGLPRQTKPKTTNPPTSTVERAGPIASRHQHLVPRQGQTRRPGWRGGRCRPTGFLRPSRYCRKEHRLRCCHRNRRKSSPPRERTASSTLAATNRSLSGH